MVDSKKNTLNKSKYMKRDASTRFSSCNSKLPARFYMKTPSLSRKKYMFASTASNQFKVVVEIHMVIGDLDKERIANHPSPIASKSTCLFRYWDTCDK